MLRVLLYGPGSRTGAFFRAQKKLFDAKVRWRRVEVDSSQYLTSLPDDQSGNRTDVGNCEW